MKRIITIVFFITLVMKVLAGEGDTNINISGGYLYNRTLDTSIAIEFNYKYHNAYEFYIEGQNTYTTAPDGRVYSNTFWYYPTISVGGAWKPVAYTWKNSVLRYRAGADIGANKNNLQASIDIGLELSYYTKIGVGIFIQQKNEVSFWCRDHFRSGINVGFKFPIN